MTGWFCIWEPWSRVIGLVQVGLQGNGGRYTYVLPIGIFMIIAWGLGTGRRMAIPESRADPGRHGGPLCADDPDLVPGGNVADNITP